MTPANANGDFSQRGSIRPSYMALVDRVHEYDGPETVYHYTTSSGLLGIVNSSAIWCTDSRYLNDFTECRIAQDLAVPEFMSVGADWAGRFSEYLIENATEGSATRHPQYIASFSSDPDSLPQWRAYGDSTGSFAVGIRTLGLKGRLDGDLLKCVYDRARQRDLIRDWVDLTVREVTAIGDSSSQAHLVLMMECYLGLLLLGAIFKSPGFETEQEYRLVCTRQVGPADEPRLQFRPGRGGIVPYIAAPLTFPVGPIVVGPTPHPRIAVAAVETLLASRKADGLVRRSELPYRYW